MPTIIRIPRWIQSRLQFTELNQLMEMTLSWQATVAGDWTAADLANFNSGLITAVIPTLKSMTPNILSFTRLISTDMGTLAGAQYITPISQNGSLTGDTEPLSLTNVLSLRTGVIGRSHRGRMYLPPTDEGNFDNGVFTASYMVKLQAFANAIYTYTGGGGRTAALAIASRKNLALYPVLSFTYDNIPDNQRKRLQNRGR